MSGKGRKKGGKKKTQAAKADPPIPPAAEGALVATAPAGKAPAGQVVQLTQEQAQAIMQAQARARMEQMTVTQAPPTADELAAALPEAMAAATGMGDRGLSGDDIELCALRTRLECMGAPEEYIVREVKRLDISRKVAALKEARDAAERGDKQKAFERATRFGTHPGITCDGCLTSPIIGFRYNCSNCKNHDLCETCYERWTKGTLPHANGRANRISEKVEDHSFKTMAEKGFKPMVKGKSGSKAEKVKPNMRCPCGSGKKYKK